MLLAPVGTKALVFLDPTKRNTWQQHAVDAWFVGPAKQHYRCYRFYIPDTKAYRITNTAKFFPAHCKLPAIEPSDTIRLAAQDLIKALLNNTHQTAPIDLTEKHTEALQKLAEIFDTSIRVDPEKENHKPPNRQTRRSPRVHNNSPARVPPPSTSHDATSPRVLRSQTQVHQRVTRQNKPMPVIFEESRRSLQRIRTREN